VSKCEDKYVKYFSKTKALAEVISERELQKYCETQFVSKNKNLKDMIMSLLEKTVGQDDELYHYVKNNHWRELDAYIRANPGKVNFFRILTQFFLFRYYSSPDIEITRKQFQIALGIQQVRWMIDDENPNKRIKREYNDILMIDADFVFWEDIPADAQDIILSVICAKTDVFYGHDKEMHSSGDSSPHPPTYRAKKDVFYGHDKGMHSRYRAIKDVFYGHDKGMHSSGDSSPHPPTYRAKKVTQVSKNLANTVWYRVSATDTSFTFDFTHNRTMPYFTVPETLNFSNIACKYAPTLMFGSISEQSLVKYQLFHNMRPYAAHLPDSTSNLTIIHNIQQSIVVNWTHDFIHQNSNNSCDVSGTYRYINYMCKLPLESYEKVTAENIVEHIENNGTFQQCMDSTFPKNGELLGEVVAGALNDTGRLYGIVPVIE
jgi:hypothetical protein